MSKPKAEVHAETRSSRRTPNPSSSALSAPPREKKSGWQTRRLGDLCRIRTGKKDVNEGNPDGKFPFFTCAAEHTFSDNYSFDTEALLIAGNGDVGKVSYYNGKFEAYQRTYVLSDFAEVSPRFLYLILDGKLKDTVSKQKLGNTMPYIKVGMLTDFQLPVPPLAEQKRIVGLLDEAFEGLATAKANAEKNLQNARALFESHLQSVFTQRGPGWVEKPLGEISQFKNGLNYSKSSGGQTLPVVGVADFQENYFVPLSELQSATIDGDLADNYAIQPNDILTVRSNGSKHLVGRCMLVGDVDEVVSYSGFIIRIRFDAKTLFPQFLLHFMKCQVTRDILTAGGGGANITNINQEKLSSLLVPLPPYKTQIKLAAALDSMRVETQRLARLYARKLAALEALKKSLLHQAFTGAL